MSENPDAKKEVANRVQESGWTVLHIDDWPWLRMDSARSGTERHPGNGVLVESEARRAGAFVSITTYISHRPDSPWTHMRIFVLKDREQAANLEALDDAGLRVEPDESKRKANADLAATLRDLVSHDRTRNF